MPAQRAKGNAKGTYRSHSPAFLDARTGLGYGSLNPTGFNASRQAQSGFPYEDPDPYEGDDIELDLEDMGVITKANMGYKPTDFLSINKTDPFYYAAGNTTGLGGMSELAVAKNSISPLPTLYKGKQAAAMGGVTHPAAYDERPAKKTGTLQGYSHRPPETSYSTHDDIGAYRLQDLLDDDELAVAKVQAIQNYINKISGVNDVPGGDFD